MFLSFRSHFGSSLNDVRTQRPTRRSRPLLSMQLSPLSQVKAAERYIRGQLQMGLATREAACDGQTKNLSELIRAKSNISQDECSELFEYLEVDNNTFTKEQRTSIAQLANTRCGSLMDQGASASGDSHQKNLHLQFYYPAWLWS